MYVIVPTSEIFQNQIGLLVENNRSYFKVKWDGGKIGTYTHKNNTYEKVSL